MNVTDVRESNLILSLVSATMGTVPWIKKKIIIIIIHFELVFEGDVKCYIN